MTSSEAAETGDTSHTIRSVVKAFRILELFDRHQPSLTIGDIANKAGLNRATAYRLCMTLVDLGYLDRQDNGPYRLGLKAVGLAQAAAGTHELPELALPVLQRLQEQTSETVNLAVLEGTEIVYLARLRSQHILGIQLSVGSRIPFHASSLGKAIAAFLPVHELDVIMKNARLDRLTDHTISTSAQFRRELGTIRTQGYALNLEEMAPGIRGIAMPLFNHVGYPVAAVNIALTRQLSADEIIAELHPPLAEATAEISASLGYSPQRQAGKPQ